MAGTTRFTVREEYTGPLLPVIWWSMPNLGASFRQFATGLKQRARALTVRDMRRAPSWGPFVREASAGGVAAAAGEQEEQAPAADQRDAG